MPLSEFMSLFAVMCGTAFFTCLFFAAMTHVIDTDFYELDRKRHPSRQVGRQKPEPMWVRFLVMFVCCIILILLAGIFVQVLISMGIVTKS